MFNIYYYILPIDLYFINIYSSAFLYFEKYRFEFINDLYCTLTIDCRKKYEEIILDKSFTVLGDKKHISKNKIIEYITKDVFADNNNSYEEYINSYTVKCEDDYEKRIKEMKEINEKSKWYWILSRFITRWKY